MRITSLLKPEAVKIGGVASDKDDAITKLVKLMETQGNVVDVDAYTEAVHTRESFGSTALGEGIAIPHAKTAAVSAPGLAAMTLPEGVDYDAPDGLPFSIATGVSAAPYFEKLLGMAKEKYGTIKGQVYAIENDFFGRSINVTGLITGQDLIRQLKGKDLGQRLLISQNMLRREEMDFLDDVPLEQASKELGVPICPVEQDGFALWDAMAGELPEVRLPKRSAPTEYYQYNQN